jgi:two-component system nitrate/nitrite response regulator NarL
MRRARVLIAQERPYVAPEFAREVAVEQVSRVPNLREALAERKPAVLILALDLPGLGGSEGLRQLRSLSPATKIIAVSRRPTAREEVDVLRAGAKGYCTNQCIQSMLPKAVQKVQEGEIWAGRRAIGALFDEVFGRVNGEPHIDVAGVAHEPVGLDRLTVREHEIVTLLRDGATNKEIATALNVSVSTVKAHLTNVFRKLEQPDRLRLALYLSSQHH